MLALSLAGALRDVSSLFARRWSNRAAGRAISKYPGKTACKPQRLRPTLSKTRPRRSFRAERDRGTGSPFTTLDASAVNTPTEAARTSQLPTMCRPLGERPAISPQSMAGSSPVIAGNRSGVTASNRARGGPAWCRRSSVCARLDRRGPGRAAASLRTDLHLHRAWSVDSRSGRT